MPGDKREREFVAKVKGATPGNVVSFTRTPLPSVVQSPPNEVGTHFMLKAALHPVALKEAFHAGVGSAETSVLTDKTGVAVQGSGAGEAVGGGTGTGGL